MEFFIQIIENSCFLVTLQLIVQNIVVDILLDLMMQ